MVGAVYVVTGSDLDLEQTKTNSLIRKIAE